MVAPLGYADSVPTDGSGIALHDVTVPVVIYFLAVLTLTAFVVTRVVDAVGGLRRAREARRRFSETPPAELRAGLVELAGTVETDPPEAPAVTLCLRQQAFGAGFARNPRTNWKEQERTVEARPFTLALNGGSVRVEVLPGERPQLIAPATLTPAAPRDRVPRERILSASLAHGQRARVGGVLAPAPDDASGYRDAPHRFVLRAPEGGRLTVEVENATSGMDDVDAARGRSAAEIIRATLLFTAVPAAWTTLTLARSTTVTATVTRAATCTGHSKSGAYRYACFEATAPDGETRFHDLRGEATVGAPVRISFARDVPFRCALGETLEPDLFSAVFMGLGTLFLAVIVGFGRRRDDERWYDVEPFDSNEAP